MVVSAQVGVLYQRVGYLDRRVGGLDQRKSPMRMGSCFGGI